MASRMARRNSIPSREGNVRAKSATRELRVKVPVSDRRAEILDAATRRIAEHGFEATTVRQIADDVGMLSGSLYHHFATKDEMLYELVGDVLGQIHERATRIADSKLDAERRLIALVLLELTELTRNQKLHAILNNERRIFRYRPEFAHVLEAKKGIYREWRKVLEAGIGAKLFRRDLDVFLTIMTILRMLNNAADWFKNDEGHGYSDDESYSLDDVIDFHLRFVLNGIRVGTRQSAPVPRAAAEDLVKQCELPDAKDGAQG
jgi:TetR/AcrR family transcriptional regulator, cholesterol catabolism regulator